MGENTNWYCSEHKPARVAVEFFGNSHDEDQSLAKEYYNAYFKELKGRKEKIRSTAKSHKGQGLMAEVEAQSECNPRVTVKLASKRYKSHQVVGDNYEGVEPEQSVLVGGLDSASVWSYLLIGLLGLAAVAFACCCYTGVRAVLKPGREAYTREFQRTNRTAKPFPTASMRSTLFSSWTRKSPRWPGGRRDDSVGRSKYDKIAFQEIYWCTQ